MGVGGRCSCCFGAGRFGLLFGRRRCRRVWGGYDCEFGCGWECCDHRDGCAAHYHIDNDRRTCRSWDRAGRACAECSSGSLNTCWASDISVSFEFAAAGNFRNPRAAHNDNRRRFYNNHNNRHHNDNDYDNHHNDYYCSIL